MVSLFCFFLFFQVFLTQLLRDLKETSQAEGRSLLAKSDEKIDTWVW
jgi:hypothetical protein